MRIGRCLPLVGGRQRTWFLAGHNSRNNTPSRKVLERAQEVRSNVGSSGSAGSLTEARWTSGGCSAFFPCTNSAVAGVVSPVSGVWPPPSTLRTGVQSGGGMLGILGYGEDAHAAGARGELSGGHACRCRVC
jgi:hypothetical protein